MPPYSDELWNQGNMPKLVNVTVLLPNGLMFNLTCSKESTLKKIKNEVWDLAKKAVLYRFLLDMNSYVFSAILQDGKRDEFYDEHKRLCDLKLFIALFKLVEPKGNKEENILNSKISIAISNDFNKTNDPEANEFRIVITNFVKDIVEHRNALSLKKKLEYYFPPEIDDYYFLVKTKNNQTASNYLDVDFEKKLNSIIICVWLIDNNSFLEEKNIIKKNCTVEVDSLTIPENVIYKVLKNFSKLESASPLNEEQLNENKTKYFLKVCGTEQYFISDIPILRFKYIVECISKEKIPKLMLVLKKDVVNQISPTTFIVSSFMKKNTNNQDKNFIIYEKMRDKKLKFLGKQMCNKFSVTIKSAIYLNITNVEKIYVRCGLYHGTELLCKPVETNKIKPEIPDWDERLNFEINMEDIPRNAKLCLAVCAIRKKSQVHYAISWGNLQVFDYYGKLSFGRIFINLFPMPKGNNNLLYPLGISNSKLNKTSSSLEIEFDPEYSKIIFPIKAEILKYGKFAFNLEKSQKSYNHRKEKKSRNLPKNSITPEENERLIKLLKKDQLSIISEEDKDFLWKWREMCLKIPDSIPKLIDSVNWNNRDEVSQLYFLLENWKQVKVETALELLDCKYPDNFVRNQAVKWLSKTITDEQLYQYLLQLVQVLKFEPYFDNSLTRFLIHKSLLNRKLGHYFFWHIKAEMNEPFYVIRFGLVLEAYCRSIGDNLLDETIKQVIALEKLKKLTDNLKMSKIDTQKKKAKYLVDYLTQESYSESLKNFRNPLNFTILLGNLNIDLCQIMDSAKKPLWLVWENLDILDECDMSNNTIIFKSGDDLRQDMLALQVIKIINFIWRNEGFDLKMMPYTCLATGKQVGMIEVIKNAITVMNIQKQRGVMAALQVDSKQLNKWIKEKNKDNYDKAVDNFTRSCAGYCVATFILGIGDRNPDNIMIREDGQIFHIDFGHFLGHFKKKLGISRERVPFVLTSDFLRVIAKGAENPQKSPEFDKFSELCGKAYLSLRKHTNLLITLFTMMLYTGIPELQSIEDIEHLRTTLQVEKTELDALTYFNEKFREANGGNWSTKIDWFFHHVAHVQI